MRAAIAHSDLVSVPLYYAAQVNLSPYAARWLATWFGSGKSPIAPGTVGSLATLPLHLLLRRCGGLHYAAVTITLTAAGVWAADRVAAELGDKDPSSVVIDEVVGTLLALGLCGPAGVVAEIAAFALFRVLDITKPGIIDRAQRLRPAGLGIMADDVLAGIGAGLVVRLARR